MNLIVIKNLSFFSIVIIMVDTPTMYKNYDIQKYDSINNKLIDEQININDVSNNYSPQLTDLLSYISYTSICGSSDIYLFVENILNNIINIIGADLGNISIVKDDDTLECISLAEKISGTLLSNSTDKNKIKPITPILRQCINNNVIIVSDDYETDPRRSIKNLPEGHISIKNFMCIPLTNKGECIAIIFLANKTHRNSFSIADLLDKRISISDDQTPPQSPPITNKNPESLDSEIKRISSGGVFSDKFYEYRY